MTGAKLIIRIQTRNRHPIPRPHGRAMGVSLVSSFSFLENWQRYNGTVLYHNSRKDTDSADGESMRHIASNIQPYRQHNSCCSTEDITLVIQRSRALISHYLTMCMQRLDNNMDFHLMHDEILPMAGIFKVWWPNISRILCNHNLAVKLVQVGDQTDLPTETLALWLNKFHFDSTFPSVTYVF